MRKYRFSEQVKQEIVQGLKQGGIEQFTDELLKRNADRTFEERIAIAFGAIQMAYGLEVIMGDEFDTLIDIYVKYKQRRQL